MHRVASVHMFCRKLCLLIDDRIRKNTTKKGYKLIASLFHYTYIDAGLFLFSKTQGENNLWPIIICISLGRFCIFCGFCAICLGIFEIGSKCIFIRQSNIFVQLSTHFCFQTHYLDCYLIAAF